VDHFNSKPLTRRQAGHSHAKKVTRPAGLSPDASKLEGNISTVLIVDNDDSFRSVLRTLLEEDGGIGYCIPARSGTEAIDIARHLLPKMAILDFSLPDMDGLQLAQELRKMMPRLPIFMLTTDYSVDFEHTALSCGVSAVFSKLGDLGTLVANARAVCGLE
jgi:DNA-binding NarL/FixJ family response regulator